MHGMPESQIMKNTFKALTLLSGLLFVLPFGLFDVQAQIVPSPRGSVSQTIDGTTIEIDYARPALRGRTGLFGGQVWWGHIWTPGANDASTITVNKDITINGQELPAGKYSMWMVVEPGDWKVLIDPRWDQFHLPEPEPTGEEITFWVTPDTTAALTETLTFDFPTHSNTGTSLRLRWENHEVVMDIEVESSLKLDITRQDVEPYEGTFHVEVRKSQWFEEPFEYDMTFSWADSSGRFNAEIVWEKGGSPQPWPLLPIPDVAGIFHPAFFNDDGHLVTTQPVYFEFIYDDSDRPNGFELRSASDELMMVGSR